MTWDFAFTILCIALVVIAGWSLLHLLKERQASDRSYDGDDTSPRYPGGDGSAGA